MNVSTHNKFENLVSRLSTNPDWQRIDEAIRKQVLDEYSKEIAEGILYEIQREIEAENKPKARRGRKPKVQPALAEENED